MSTIQGLTAQEILNLIDQILLVSGWIEKGESFYPAHWEKTPNLPGYILAPWSRQNAIMLEVKFREWVINHQDTILRELPY